MQCLRKCAAKTAVEQQFLGGFERIERDRRSQYCAAGANRRRGLDFLRQAAPSHFGGRKKMNGLHLIGDLTGCRCDPQLLLDGESFRAKCLDMVSAAGLTTMDATFHTFE